MKKTYSFFCLSCLFCVTHAAQAADVGTAFTYQGHLEKPAGIPVEDTCDFRFSLYGAPTGGSVIGNSPQTVSSVAVTRGVFTTTMDFGVEAIDGTGRWLAIEIQCSQDADFVPMDTRVELRPAPYSIRAGTGVGGPMALNVTGTGDVGIGTTAPAVKLEVAGNMHTTGELTIGGTPARSDHSQANLLAGIRINGALGSIQSQGPIGLSAPQVNFDGAIEVGGGMDVAGPVRGGGGFEFPDGSISISAPPPSPPSNQIAMLRWDLIARSEFPVGIIPLAVIFDGSNVWVASTLGGAVPGSVSKLRASDGSTLGTFPSGGFAPTAMVYDGNNIWVANFNGGQITKLRASDGSNLGTFSVCASYGMAFDGANIWVACRNLDNVRKLRASDGADLGAISVGNGPSAVAFDGANVWVTNQQAASVTKLRVSDGANLGTFAVGPSPYGVACDGANIWVTSYSNDNVTKLRASNGANLGAFPAGNGPYGVAFDGANIWVTNQETDGITKLRASDGATLGTFQVGTDPYGVAFDGANIWVANSGNAYVSKIFIGG